MTSFLYIIEQNRKKVSNLLEGAPLKSGEAVGGIPAIWPQTSFLIHVLTLLNFTLFTTPVLLDCILPFKMHFYA